jgi:ABC-type antimicrobial peptide transport system permease subunit
MTVMIVGIRELAQRWRLALACLLLVMVPVGLFVSLRLFLSGMHAEYSRMSAGMLVVQKSDSMGEIYGSRLGLQTAKELRQLGYENPIPAIQEIAGTTITNAVLLRGVDLLQYPALDEFQILAGHRLDLSSAPRSAMVGYRLAEARSLAVGDLISLRGRDFTVTAIFKTGAYLDNQVWISLADAQALFNYGQDVSVYIIPDDGPLHAGDTLHGSLAIAQRGEMIKQISEEYLSIVNFMGWVVQIMAWATAAMLANILWRLAWQQRREMSLLRTLGFGTWTPGLYLAAQALAIVLPGSLLGVLAAQTVGKEVIQHIAGFGLDTSFEPSTLLSAGALSLAIMLSGIAVPIAWFRRFDLAELLRSE